MLDITERVKELLDPILSEEGIDLVEINVKKKKREIQNGKGLEIIFMIYFREFEGYMKILRLSQKSNRIHKFIFLRKKITS